MASRCQVCSTNHSPRCQSTALALTWPVDALVEAVGSPAEVCRRLGWHSSRGMPAYFNDASADLWAIKCGLHPELVWPGWCEAGLTERDRRFVNDGGWRTSWLYLERLREAAVEVAA